MRPQLCTILVALVWVVACGGAGRAPEATAAASETPVEDERIDVLALDSSTIQARLREDPTALGSVSLGRPNGGALFGAVRMPEGPHWQIVDPHHAWATRETVDYLVKAITAAHEAAPGEPLFIGHLSRKEGGRLWPHASHQSGRDVDLGYYYLPGTRGGWYQRAAKVNLDRKRTWALLRALIVHTDVEHIFISRGVQRLLREHALSIGEDADWLQSIFDHRSVHPAPLVRNVMGHTTHMHVRFFNPQAQYVGLHGHEILAGKTRYRRRLLPPQDKPIPDRRVPPDPAGMTATN